MTPDTPAMDENGLEPAFRAFQNVTGEPLNEHYQEAISGAIAAYLAATAREEGSVEDALTGNAGLLGARAMASESLKSVASVKIGGSRLLSTPPAGDLGAVKVRQLAWERAVGYKAKTYSADSIVGLYTVNVHGAVYFDSKLIASSGDLEAAKTAAQSDYTSRILSALSSSPVEEMVHQIEHDGFEGTVIGSYVTREGKRGVVLQQVGTKVVHVYGEKWLRATGGGR